MAWFLLMFASAIPLFVDGCNMETNDKPTAHPGHLKLLLEQVLPTLLQLAVKDERFRKLIAAGMSQEIQLHEGKKGVDPHAVHSLKSIFDQMIEDRCSREIDANASKINPITLRLKMFKARDFILGYADPDGKYSDLDKQIEFQDIKNEDRQLTGIKIAFVRDMQSPLFIAKKLEQASADLGREMNWRNTLFDFIDNGEEDTAMHLTELRLTDDDISAVRTIANEMAASIRVDVLTKSEIKLAKVKADK
jgi:hypothetical protein